MQYSYARPVDIKKTTCAGQKEQVSQGHRVQEHCFKWLSECFRPDFLKLIVFPCLNDESRAYGWSKHIFR